MKIEEYTCDVLVIGSGGAGCKCGIVASKNGQNVIIVSITDHMNPIVKTIGKAKYDKSHGI